MHHAEVQGHDTLNQLLASFTSLAQLIYATTSKTKLRVHFSFGANKVRELRLAMVLRTNGRDTVLGSLG